MPDTLLVLNMVMVWNWAVSATLRYFHHCIFVSALTKDRAGNNIDNKTQNLSFWLPFSPVLFVDYLLLFILSPRYA